ncbi:MAG: FAD:protein FMN transferase, partial [Propionibacteriaceae bacterium]|nr:FAD:protein FMN transferase [Propionibacteriaceae bacterium]
FVEVLAAAQRWYETSEGAFHPAAGALRQRWLVARDSGAEPSPEELSELAATTRELPFRVSRGAVERVADCGSVDLNAIAKGYIVDRAAAVAGAVRRVTSVMVNAGGDLRHRGPGGVTVGVEDPARPYDNAPPRWRVRVCDGGLATSGSARRGFRVGGRWLGHVLDPRTGWPVEHTTSVTVLAQDAMTADALATVLGVLEPEEAIAFAASRGIGCMVVDAAGDVLTSPDWPD